MAYMNQEKKSKIAPKVKSVLKKYGLKGSLAVKNNSTLVLNIREGSLDFIGNWNESISKRCEQRGERFSPAKGNISVNQYWIKDTYSGKVAECLEELTEVMNDGNFDNSDPMTDYFHVGWYVDINIGKWNKDYKLV
jgi:hypothetical protein